MESMGKKPRRRRSFTPEFKAEIVGLCQQGDRSIGQIAKDFDLTETAVREWVKQAERDSGARKRTTIPDPAAPARTGLNRRDFTADASRLNTRWCGDITYIPTGEGWLYLAENHGTWPRTTAPGREPRR